MGIDEQYEKWLEEQLKCPKCGGEMVRDEIDIGVGTMYSPARCNECGWSQQEESDKYLKESGIKDN